MKKINQRELDILIEKHNTYLKAPIDNTKQGKRLLLDEVDFTDNDLSNLNFVDTYITSSFFNSQVFDNINLAEAKLYSCIFENIVFKNCNFGKTVLDYAEIINSKFLNCNLIQLETLESHFERLSFYNCIFNGAFSNCSLKGATFEKCTFISTEFWECSIENLKISDKNNQWDLKKIIQKINIGTITNPIFIKDLEAIKYFESRCEMF